MRTVAVAAMVLASACARGAMLEDGPSGAGEADDAATLADDGAVHADGASEAGADASHEAASDASADTASDVSLDAASDAPLDVSVDTSHDTTSDAVDATHDVSVDTSIDAPIDAPIDANADAPADTAVTDTSSDVTATDTGVDAAPIVPCCGKSDCGGALFNQCYSGICADLGLIPNLALIPCDDGECNRYCTQCPGVAPEGGGTYVSGKCEKVLFFGWITCDCKQ